MINQRDAACAISDPALQMTYLNGNGSVAAQHAQTVIWREVPGGYMPRSGAMDASSQGTILAPKATF